MKNLQKSLLDFFENVILVDRVIHFVKFISKEDEETMMENFTLAFIESGHVKIFYLIDKLYWSKKRNISYFRIHLMRKNHTKYFNHIRKCPLLKCAICLEPFPFEGEADGDDGQVDFDSTDNYVWGSRCNICDQMYCDSCERTRANKYKRRNRHCGCPAKNVYKIP